MDEEWLAEIEQDAMAAHDAFDGSGYWMDAILALIAEVRRLRSTQPPDMSGGTMKKDEFGRTPERAARDGLMLMIDLQEQNGHLAPEIAAHARDFVATLANNPVIGAELERVRDIAHALEGIIMEFGHPALIMASARLDSPDTASTEQQTAPPVAYDVGGRPYCSACGDSGAGPCRYHALETGRRRQAGGAVD